MLKAMHLVNYKGFRDFRITFDGTAFLLGPNNAGKSTIIGALRLCGGAIRVAMRLKATEICFDGDRVVRGHSLNSVTAIGFTAENVRYEFGEVESKILLQFTTGAVIHITWPVEDRAFFWIEYPEGMQVTLPTKSREVLVRIGLVPTLTPIDHEERVLSTDHVRSHYESKIASRHFRNQLRLTREQPEDATLLKDFLLENTPEITDLDMRETYAEGHAWLDCFYRDADSRIEKELFWAGDGMQIWLQILFHLWRSRGERVVVLDEPDVFLHPDLQRRLVRILEQRDQQIILATHAPEMASEARPNSIIWIDRVRRRARRLTQEAQFADLSQMLGSAFNLSVARALRSKVALFVEGEDLKILRILARRIGALRFTQEEGLAVIPIGGFTHWPSVEAFAWLRDQLLGESVEVHLLLDRDYHPEDVCLGLEAEMLTKGVHAHVWRRKELESYLVELPLMARISKIEMAMAKSWLDEIVGEMKSRVFGQFMRWALEAKTKGADVSSVSAKALTDFETLWRQENVRPYMVPAKELLKAWNKKCQEGGKVVVTPRKLAESLRVGEMAPELVEVIRSIEVRL